ncbi:MAG TPA: hypothetical protein VKG02_21760, partial [Blastocatellia bacterium]|nr:hypothetical protein [Blastocatellia bacterium]
PARIVGAAREILSGGVSHAGRVPELWDGHAADRVVEALIAKSDQTTLARKINRGGHGDHGDGHGYCFSP